MGNYLAASQGKVGMAIGNGIGSVICNTALIMSISIIFVKMTVKRREFTPKAICLLAAVVVLFICSAGGSLSIGGAVCLLVVFALFIFENIRSAKGEKTAAEAEQEKPDKETTGKDRKSTRLNSSHEIPSRMPSSA